MRRILTFLTILGLIGVLAAPAWSYRPASLDVGQALSEDPAVAAEGVSRLRSRGAAGLNEVFEQRDRLQARTSAESDPARAAALQESIKQLDAIADKVGGARYCSASRLFWHTEFSQAKAEAEKTNKPILSLRMLGNLNEEFSCANSRFFRTTLYANEEISKTLREKFVLHWESVRPVPKITIDFGDGRKLERTLTGNSIHYVVAADGRPLDGLPGLYGPQAFTAWLARAEVLAQQYAAAQAADREALLTQYHQARLEAIAKMFAADMRRVKEIAFAANADAGQRAVPPRAAEAAKLARGKGEIELKLVDAAEVASPLPATMDEIDEATWQQIAALHTAEATLDNASKNVIQAENPDAVRAGMRAMTKARLEDPLVRLVRKLESSIALDTVRNEYVLHRQLHQWFVNAEAAHEVAPLNERVYAVLFLTPSSDPWLGLAQPDTYTALTNGGVVQGK